MIRSNIQNIVVGYILNIHHTEKMHFLNIEVFRIKFS